MKSSQKITRLHLNDNQNDGFFLLGLVSAEPDYKLSLAINKKFRIKLKNSDPVSILEAENNKLLFSRFSDSALGQEIFYTLVSNRSGKNFLLKKLKNIDYLFIMHDTENENKHEEFASSLREIESISAIFNIDINTLKDKNLQHIIH